MAAKSEDQTREGLMRGGQVKSDPPNPEVVEKAARRKFTTEYKLRILHETDRRAPGELGALLRREGLYSSHLAKWREHRERAEREALAPQKRGRKAQETNPLAPRVAELERDKERLQHRLQQAEAIIEVQKKISELLGIPLKGGSN
jgi:transposase